MARKPENQDKELERYRSLLQSASEYKDGFGWTTVVGIIFCGLIMMPGGIYLSLMTGANISMAAQWVTVIMFMEIARRALRPLNTQNLIVLLHAAHVMIAAHFLFPGGPMGELVYRGYLVGSEAVRDAGMIDAFPTWFAPKFDSPAITERNLLHIDWLVPVAIALAVLVASLVKKYTLGYFFFRLTSDVERLPFPLAPISAQGAMALAESEEEDDKNEGLVTKLEKDPDKEGEDKGANLKKGDRWRVFSLGAYMGIAFGFLQVGIPAITSLFLAEPFYLIPQPFIDTTTTTEGFLPATPTGIAFDLGLLFMGFVLPFWSVMGTAFAIVLTIILNPILQNLGILRTWQPGMDTVNTTFANNIDFYLSFGIGAGFGIAAVSIFSTIRDLRARSKALREQNDTLDASGSVWALPRDDRGDYPLWIALVLYVVTSLGLLVMICSLLGWAANIVGFVAFFLFIYNPFISYVNARLLGIAGQTIVIPHIKEIGFVLSGAKGVDIWLAPVPQDNFGYMAQAYRVNELTGVNFWSLIKTEIVALPVLFILSLAFWGFIWKSDPVPSDIFPAAQVKWELHAKNQVLLFSSTFQTDDEGNRVPFDQTELGKALHYPVIGVSFASVTAAFTILSSFGLPVMFVYGFLRGIGDLPHMMVMEVVGALIARIYLWKRFGTTRFLTLAPALLAGYMTGVGLIGMATIALRLIKSAVSSEPF